MADDVCPMAVTRTYVVSTIDTGETNADMTKAFGFDLDHMVGGTTGRPCTAAPDFHSITTNAEGVDNQLSTVLPLLGMMLMGGVNGAIQQQIQGGTLLLMFEVSEINDFTTDPAVMVHIVLGQVPAPGMVMTAGMGIAPGQTFTTMMDIATVPGTITAGRLSATTTMLPLSFMAMGAAVTLTLRDVVVGGNISAMGGFTNGEFGQASCSEIT